MLVDGEIDLGTAWNGRVYTPKTDGAPIDYTYDQALYSSDAMVVPKGARNKKASMQFLAHMMEAKHQAAFATLIPYGPVNSKAFELLSADALKVLPQLTGKRQDGYLPGCQLLGRKWRSGAGAFQ